MTPEADHPTEHAPSSSTPSSSSTQASPSAASDGGSAPAASRLSSAARFARRHRRLTIASVAGVALLSEPELAVGVLLGAGTLALLTRRARGAADRTATASASASAEAAGESHEAEATQPGAAPTGEDGHPGEQRSGSGRGFARRAEALGHEVRERARAVAQAARGSLHPTQSDGGPAGHEEPPETGPAPVVH